MWKLINIVIQMSAWFKLPLRKWWRYVVSKEYPNCQPIDQSAKKTSDNAFRQLAKGPKAPGLNHTRAQLPVQQSEKNLSVHATWWVVAAATAPAASRRVAVVAQLCPIQMLQAEQAVVKKACCRVGVLYIYITGNTLSSGRKDLLPYQMDARI